MVQYKKRSGCCVLAASGLRLHARRVPAAHYPQSHPKLMITSNYSNHI